MEMAVRRVAELITGIPVGDGPPGSVTGLLVRLIGTVPTIAHAAWGLLT